jgi:hypothetical protein
MVLVSMHSSTRMLVPAKTPVLALTVAHRKFVFYEIRMTDFPVLHPWSRLSSAPVMAVEIRFSSELNAS